MNPPLSSAPAPRPVRRFAAIPYAQPPVGALRFAPPQPLDAAPALRADAPIGPISPQSPSRLSSVMGDFARTQDEDCLQLTVWTPGTDGARRPVLFWIHGGAFMSGAGALDWYDGATLAGEGDVVVVSPNYRLGALGFLCHPALCAGNLGLLDVELALQWTHRHIARFGGDPERITVMGQSAGAWAAALMTARLPAGSGAIRQLILHSGPLGIGPATPDTAKTMADEFLAALAGGRTPGPGEAAALARARSATTADILGAQGQAIRNVGSRLTPPGQPPVPFGPVGDGRVIPVPDDYPAWLEAAARRLPVLVGWTRDEMGAFQPAAPGHPQPPANAQATQAIFADPSLRWAQAAGAAGQPAYAFQFDWAPPASPFGACHCIELPFAFGTLKAFAQAPMLGGQPTAAMAPLSRAMRAAWLAFTRHGDPNATEGAAGGLPAWPACRPGASPVMQLDSSPSVRLSDAAASR